jgi:hypothetical protein
MARVSYSTIIEKYHEERIASGNEIDTYIILIPDDPNILEQAIRQVFEGEDNGFLDKMFDTDSRLGRQ